MSTTLAACGRKLSLNVDLNTSSISRGIKRQINKRHYVRMTSKARIPYMRYALCVMRYAVQYAACVIPLMRNAASFSFFFLLSLPQNK